MSAHEWPPLPKTDQHADRDLSISLFEAQLTDVVNSRNAEYAATAGREAAEVAAKAQALAAEDRLREAIHAAYLDVAKSALDRMLKRADLIVTIAAGAGTIYATVLGLAYSAESRPISITAVVPAMFLALALAMGAYYSGFVSGGMRRGMPLASGTSAQVQHRRMAEFIRWVNITALERSWALRTAILCLFLGTFTMPVAFISTSQWILIGLAIASAAAFLIVSWARAHRNRNQHRESSRGDESA